MNESWPLSNPGVLEVQSYSNAAAQLINKRERQGMRGPDVFRVPGLKFRGNMRLSKDFVPKNSKQRRLLRIARQNYSYLAVRTTRKHKNNQAKSCGAASVADGSLSDAPEMYSRLRNTA